MSDINLIPAPVYRICGFWERGVLWKRGRVWFIAPVLKTGDGRPSASSNLAAFANALWGVIRPPILKTSDVTGRLSVRWLAQYDGWIKKGRRCAGGLHILRGGGWIKSSPQRLPGNYYISKYNCCQVIVAGILREAVPYMLFNFIKI